VLAALGGGCSAPIGVLARIRGDDLHMLATVGSASTTHMVRAEKSGPLAQAETVARDLVAALMAAGAGALLDRLHMEKGEVGR
jgi:hydroxymethylbilane synthase